VMDRRAVVGTLAGSLLAAPLAARMQPGSTFPRIGYLMAGSFESRDTRPDKPSAGTTRGNGYMAGLSGEQHRSSRQAPEPRMATRDKMVISLAAASLSRRGLMPLSAADSVRRGVEQHDV
jgi:hypothetical protein